MFSGIKKRFFQLELTLKRKRVKADILTDRVAEQ
jgi:hypothetical protein